MDNDHQVETHKLNDFGYIDYKMPIGKMQDMRTSMYLGNKHMTDIRLGDRIHAKFQESRPYIEDIDLARQRISDSMANYKWKTPDATETRNPTVAKINHMKNFYECKVKFLKRPMLPATSVSHSDYRWHQEVPQEPPTPSPKQTPITPLKVYMDHSKPGYSKYLDPAATTSRLDYCHRSAKDIAAGIGANDNITFWNWPAKALRLRKVFRETDAQLCDYLPSKDCVKRRCEYTNMVKVVPNTGLTTEVRDNYLEPYKRLVEYNSNQTGKSSLHVQMVPTQDKTEYSMYGSRESTKKFV